MLDSATVLAAIVAAKKAVWDGRREQVAMNDSLLSINPDAVSKWAIIETEIAASTAEADYLQAELDLLNKDKPHGA